MTELTATVVIESLLRATADDATPIIRRLARNQARVFLDSRAGGAGEIRNTNAYVLLEPDAEDVRLCLKGAIAACPCCEGTPSTFARFFPHSGIYQGYVNCSRCHVQVMANARDREEARGLAIAAWSKRPATPAPAVDAWTLVERLRDQEADSVTILCDNPDGPPNNAVECCGFWTGFVERRFDGDTIIAALQSAVAAKDQADRDGHPPISPAVDAVPAGEVDTEVQRIVAMSDDEVMAEADASDVAWARAFKQGLRAGQRASTTGPLVKALEWYRDQASRVRMVHSEGEAARNALDADCGKLASDALAALSHGEGRK